jgi:ABC-2 type transport system ATP-binding protein
MEIKVEGVSKSFGRDRALDRVSFELTGTGVFGYLGPNGAGKTTTMKILTSLLRADEGSAYVNGIDVSREPVRALSFVGSLVEDPEPYSFMSVRDFIFFAAEIRRRARPDILALKERLDLPPLDRNCAKLSKGQKRRVLLGAILAQDPEILILDEPTAGLDPSESIVFRNIIQKLKSEKLIFLSSHLLYEATQVCDRVLFLNKGRIVEEGTVEEINQRFVSRAIRIEFSSPLADEEKQFSSLKSSGVIIGYSKEGERTYVINFDGSEEKRKRIIDSFTPLGVRNISDARLGLEEAYLELLKDAEGGREMQGVPKAGN